MGLRGSPGLALADKDGRALLVIAVGADNRSGLGITDAAGTLRASIRVTPDGSPALSLHAKDGKVTWKAP